MRNSKKTMPFADFVTQAQKLTLLAKKWLKIAKIPKLILFNRTPFSTNLICMHMIILAQNDVINKFTEKNCKKTGACPQNSVKTVQKELNLRKIGKKWYYMHFAPKKYIKNYKMRVI